MSMIKTTAGGAIPAWLRGGAMLAVTAMAWGGMFAVMKPMLVEIDPFTLTLVRFGFAAPILLVLLLLVEGKKSLSFDGKALRLWWLGTLAFPGFGLMTVLGLSFTQPEHAAVIPALMPLISIVVISMRTRSRPKPYALTAVTLGLVGVVLVVTRGNPSLLLQGGAGFGEMLVLFGATCWVIYTLGAAEFPSWSGLRFTTITLMWGTFSVVLIEIFVLATGFVPIPRMTSLLSAAPSFAYLVLAASVMGFIFWNAGMQVLQPVRGVLFINLVPVTAFAVALVGGHTPTGWEFSGVALVITALVVNSLASGVAQKSGPLAHQSD